MELGEKIPYFDSSNRSKVFRQLYEKVDPGYYKEEDPSMMVKPGEDRREKIIGLQSTPFQHMEDS